MSYYGDVEEFHRKFGLPHSGDGEAPVLLDHHVLLYRLAFMLEEITEMTRASYQNDLAKVTDGLVDLVYIALGTAALGRLPFDEAWDEVHRANMTKERVNGANDPRSPRGHSLDVIKPPGWTPPAIEAILERRRQRVFAEGSALKEVAIG